MKNKLGTVWSYREKSGYGWILRKDNKKYIYVNSCGISMDSLGAIEQLRKGDEVKFDIAPYIGYVRLCPGNVRCTETEFKAVNVTKFKFTPPGLLESNVLGFVKYVNYNRGYYEAQNYAPQKVMRRCLSFKSSDISGNKSLQKHEKVRFDMVTKTKATNVRSLKNQKRIDKKSKDEILERNVTGIVKWFNLSKRFGFITRQDTKDDIYVGYLGLSKVCVGRVRGIQKEDEVRFDIATAGEKVKAVNVVKLAYLTKQNANALETNGLGVQNWIIERNIPGTVQWPERYIEN